ncbi:unnamed protein product [Cuscuta epithymum]|uniref:Retrotransposon Copia-like N-terminal domain-containing protein n=1 Tax=Cuscuta epithymum TaxID=186058 RepID=A0AAV0DHV7_9ASTE|nr:unnamed protein product [Cuscuta epithymum]
MVNDGQHAVIRRKINDPSSPYYIHPSDFPGLNICGVTLKGEANFREWATAMKNAFRSKRKLGFLDGTIPMPTEEPEDLDDWITVNSMLVGWIMTSIDPSLRSNIAFMDNVMDLWDDLKTRFDVGDPMRIYELKEAIRGCRQQGQSVTNYYGRLKGIWDDFDGFRVIPKCTCGGCTCNLESKFYQQIEIEKTHDFLMGLDSESYGVLRSNILSSNELPSLSKVYQMVVQEERHRNMIRIRDEKVDAIAFAARDVSRMSMPSGRDIKLTCSFCKKTGHDYDHCFKRTGKYPDWWYENESRGRGKGQAQGSGKAVAGRPLAGRQPQPTRDSKIACVVRPEEEGGSSKNFVPELTSDQWQAILNMVNNQKATETEKLEGPTYEDADWTG